jgi:non-homologous end joining protein Ku
MRLSSVAADPIGRGDRLELEMAQDLIDRMAGDFDISQYKDGYRQQLMGVIR